MLETNDRYKIHRDFNAHTCIELDQKNGIVIYMTFNAEDGITVRRSALETFERLYKWLPHQSLKSAVKTFFDFGKYVRISNEARQYLAQLNNQFNKEFTMPHSQDELHKMSAAAKAANESKGKAKAEPKGKAKAEPKGKAKAESKGKAKAESKGKAKTPVTSKDGKEKKQGITPFMKELIMAGKLTDDEIFTQAQLKFGCDEKKRWYISWCRHDLRKKGINPPDAVVK